MIDSQRPQGFAPGEFIVDVVDSADGVAQLHEEYRDILEACENTLPFFLHRWHLSWSRHFLNQDARIRDQLFFHVVRSRSGQCVAIVPLVRSSRKLGPIDIVSINLLGADPAFTEIRGALVRPGYEQAVADSVLNGLARHREWDWIQWSGIDGSFWDALRKKAALRTNAAVPFYLLDLPPTWGEFRAGLKRNIRESIRHCYNSLRRAGLEFSFEVVSAPAAIPVALTQFLDLHSRRAGVRGTVEHPDRFERPGARAFLRTVCEGFAEDGALRIFQLRIRGEVVATRIGFVVRDSLYLYYSGFDPAWSRFSVMTTVVVESIKYAIEQGLATVNLSPGVDVSKTRWGGRAVYCESGQQHGARLHSRVAHTAYQHAVAGEGVSGQLLQRLISARRRWD